MQLFAPILSVFTGGGAAAAGTAAAGTAAATGGFSLASILQGTATVLGIAASISAGNQDAAALEMQAADAETEQALKTLEGIDRRTDARKALIDAVGSIDNAYAASGVDLSFGTVNEARSEAYREADTAIGTAGNTELSQVTRLAERAKYYRRAAKQARSSGVLQGLIGGFKGFADIAGRG